MQGFAEHEFINRRRMRMRAGVGAYGVRGGTTYDKWDTDALDRNWSDPAVVSAMPFADALKMRAAAADAVQSEGFPFSAAAKAGLAKWDAYVAKLGIVSKLTPEQYRAQQSKGTLLQQVLGGKNSALGGAAGKVLGSFGGMFGLGGPSAPTPTAMAPSNQGGGFLDALLSPVGLVLGAAGAGLAAYASTRGKKKGRRRR